MSEGLLSKMIDVRDIQTPKGYETFVFFRDYGVFGRSRRVGVKGPKGVCPHSILLSPDQGYHPSRKGYMKYQYKPYLRSFEGAIRRWVSEKKEK